MGAARAGEGADGLPEVQESVLEQAAQGGVMRQQHLFKVRIQNASPASVDYHDFFNVVAPDAEAAIKKIRKRVERGERIMGVELIASIDTV
jgi:hypothetical protein